jgi:membrane associated rhomboid family serine protease
LIPISDEVRARTFPFVEYTLIALNVVVFLYEFSLGSRAMQAFIYSYGVIPIEIVTGEQLRGVPNSVPPMATLFTSMFVHAGWLHLLSNMLYLWIFGDNVEDNVGHFGFLILYILSGLAGAFAHILFNPDSTIPTVGASGAISGVLGAYVVLYPAGRIRTLMFIPPFITFVRVPALLLIGFWFFMQLMGGLASLETPQASGVAFWAHVGGFVAGVLLVNLLRKRRSYTYYG